MKKGDIEKLRKKRNDELIELVEKGYSGNFVSPQMTHYPPRKIIQKDEDIIKRLYGEKTKVIGKPKILVIEENYIVKIIQQN